VDVLIWILVKKLAPTHSSKLDGLRESGRHRKLPEWRKEMKKEFRHCTTAPLTNPEEATWATDPLRWTCTCPAMVSSRFFVCKHLVQACEPIPARFFMIVSAHNQTMPFWSHPLLVPKAGRAEGTAYAVNWRTNEHSEDLVELEDKDVARARAQVEGFDDDVDEEEEEPVQQLALPFDLAFHSIHHDLLWMLAVLEYNRPFREILFVNIIRACSTAFFRLIADLRDLQERTDQPKQPNPTTWGSCGIASLGNFRTMQPDRVRTLRRAADAELEAVRQAL
jgi:hypothetical protein